MERDEHLTTTTTVRRVRPPSGPLPLTRSLPGNRMEGPYSPPAYSSSPTGDNIPADICCPGDCR